MAYFATLVVAGLIAYVLADIARGRVLRRNVLQLSEAFRSELAAIRETSKGFEALRDRVATDMLPGRKVEEQPRDEGDFPDFSMIVFERPYTRLSLESGIHRFVAAFDSAGQISVKEQFDNIDVLCAEEFSVGLPKHVAMDLLTSMIQDYNRLAAPSRVQPTKRLRPAS